jgi:hypothetical protein
LYLSDLKGKFKTVNFMTRLGLMSLILLLFVTCKKKQVNATLFVTVRYNLNPVVNPTVYLKSGGGHNPQIPLSQYDDHATGDENGKVIFTNLDEGDYFLVATASISSTLTATGQTSVSLVTKEMPNQYQKVIDVH